MALTNNLKQQVDLPVWEWCRFAPVATTNVSSITTGNNLGNRYLYYQVSAGLYRYDTVSDCWHQLTTTTGMSTPTIYNCNVLSNYVGHYGRAIGPGTGNNTIQMAGLWGNALVGYKIRILSGTGAGEEKTITAVSAPTVHDRGEVTTAGTQSIVDANTGTGLKQWKINQWRDYQFRCDFGAGRTQVRPILLNKANQIVWSDPQQLPTNPWAQPLTNISVAVGALYQIESHIVTVDSDWTNKPDSTSKFVVLSGGIWNFTQGTTSAPYMSMSYYDILADQWYGKTTCSGLTTAVLAGGCDVSLERFTEVGGTLFTETASAGAARSITVKATTTLVPMCYANHEIKIVGGTGKGQTRSILSNTATIINVTRDWDTAPDNTSVYEIWRDTDKLIFAGGGLSAMFQYSIDSDQWSTGKQLDFGQTNQLAATRSKQAPVAITSITRTATGMVLKGAITTAGTGYNIGDVLTVDGKGGTLLVTAIDANGGVTGTELMTCGTGYTTGAKATTCSPSGVGAGCTITLAAGDIDFTELVVTTVDHDLKVGDSVVISGASGSGAAKFNGTYTIIGTPSVVQFSYCSVGDPGAATATIANSVSNTQLVDCTKAWVVNEHVGKIIQATNSALLGTAQQRRIVSNTATTITWTSAFTATLVQGTFRYIIEDIKPFGTERSVGGVSGLGTEGFATSGSSTTLVDSTKNWIPNYWSRGVGRKVRIVEGTGVGNEVTIVSNTATTLTYVAPGFTADTTTRYVIMDTFGTINGAGGISTVAYAPTGAGSGYAIGDISAVTGGTARVKVVALSGSTVTGIILVDGGVSGYSVASGVATTNVIGTGTGLTVNVTAITAIGTTTVLQDNTKNWEVNCWIGKKVRFLTGTGVGKEYTITANTVNTLTWGADTAGDVSTAYAILEASPKTNGLQLNCILASTDTSLNSNYLYTFSGTGTVELARYNLHTEHWDLLSYFPQFELINQGAMFAYDGADRIYLQFSTTLGSTTGRIGYYDLAKNIIVPAGNLPYGHSTVISGNRMEIVQTVDGLKYLYIMRHTGQEMWRQLIFY